MCMDSEGREALAEAGEISQGQERWETGVGRSESHCVCQGFFSFLNMFY